MKSNLFVAIVILTVLFISVCDSYGCYNPPTAVLDAEPVHADIGETITFDGSGSYDDGSITKYEWDWDDSDGVGYDYNETPGDGVATHSYDTTGTYTVTLRVTDNDNNTDTDTITVYVGQIHNITDDGAYTTIQAAIDDSNDGDTIEVYKGTYTGTGNRDIKFRGKAITVRSSDPNDWEVVASTIIDCNGSSGDKHRGFYFCNGEDANSVLAGFKITNGYGPSDANTSTYYAGSGIFCYNSGTDPTIQNCLITGNGTEDASVDGGGIACHGGAEPNIISCVIYDNKAYYGGGISARGSDPTITSCIISDNSANGTSRGDGAYCYDGGDATFVNCTITQNTGEGIRSHKNSVDTAVTVTNCILWDNTDDLQTTTGGTITVTYSCIENNDSGTGVTHDDPNLVNIDDLTGGDGIFSTFDDGLRVMSYSPCVDVADGNAAPDTDITGRGRVDVDYITNSGVGDPNYVDMGAYESATAWYVDGDIASPNDGTSWVEAFDTIQDALATAGANDQVWVTGGIYYADANDVNSREASFELVADAGLYGGFAGDDGIRNFVSYETILSGDINEPNDASDNSYHVVKDANNAVLDGFTITGGNANGSGIDELGGGVYAVSTGFAINNCTVSDNNSIGVGGGLCIYDYASIAITNCAFANNTSAGGGGVMLFPDSGSSSLTNCVFTGNSSPDGGALFVVSDESTITNCTFTGNSSSNVGGAISVLLGAPVITNCILWDNEAVSDGNEIYNGMDSDPNISYSCIEDCGGSGGSWDPNFGTDGGGNIDSDPDFVDANNPSGSDGIYMTYDDGLRIDVNSSCLDAANAMVAPLLDIIYNARFDINDISNTGIGDPDYSDIGAYESFAWYVDANGSGTDGLSWATAFTTIQAGIDGASEGGFVVVTDDTFTELITFNGKAITLTSKDPYDSTIVSSTIIESTSGNYTVPVVSFDNSENSSSILRGVTVLSGPYGAEIGQADRIYCENSSPKIQHCRFVKGSHSTDGIGISCNGSDAIIEDCNIANNVGTGIYLYNSSSVTISDCNFLNNDSSAVISCSGSNITLNDCLISGNNGTGLSVSGDSNTIVSSCTITDNNDASALSFSSGVVTLDNCIITDNIEMSSSGAGLNVGNTSLTMTDCTITGNETTGYGGGMYIGGGSTSEIAISDCNINHNIANTGGGIYNLSSGSVTIQNCNIAGNNSTSTTSGDGGGGIYSTRNMNIENCKITGNKAAEDGGGVYFVVSSDDSMIKNCTVADNFAADKGGGISIYSFLSSYNSFIDSCIIWGNSADTSDDQITNDIHFGSTTTYIYYCDIQDSNGTGANWVSALGDDIGGNLDSDPCFVSSGSWVDVNDVNTTVEPNDPNALWVVGNYHLDVNSLCIDGGSPFNEYSVEPAPNGSRINMGAYGNTSEATIATDQDSDGLSDAWQSYYWSAYDPCVSDPNYDPNGNPDGDDFTNWIEYLFGYDPNSASSPSDGSMELRSNISPAYIGYTQLDSIIGETFTTNYIVNMNSDVNISFINTDTSETARVITDTVTAGHNQLIWDGTDANGVIVKSYFYDVTIDACDNDGNSYSWSSPDGGDTNPSTSDSDSSADPCDFDPYQNIPVVVTHRILNDWAIRKVNIIKDGSNPWSSGVDDIDEEDSIYHLQKLDEVLAPDVWYNYYWYGHWDVEPNAGQVCTEAFDIAFATSRPVNKGIVLVYYEKQLSSLRCNPYRILPLGDEITTITYDLAADANMTVDIYDPDGNFFGTLVDDQSQIAGTQDVIWYGTTMPEPNDPNSRYISTEGTYRIEVKNENTNEILEGSITAYE